MIPIIIQHAAWVPERKATLDRLLAQLPRDNVGVLRSRRREHASTYARRAWELAEDLGGHVCILNDDVTVCPEFPAVLAAMTTAAPERVLSLHTSIPVASRVMGRWLRSYWLTGPGYVLPPGVARQLLEYVDGLPWRFVSQFNEDNIAQHWAWDRQEPFWSPIPAVVKHDAETISTLGYDNHPMRTSPVSWDAPAADAAAHRLTDASWWTDDVEAPPFYENPWMKTDDLDRKRKALRGPNPCHACWEEAAVSQTSGVLLCGPCLAKPVAGLLRLARAT